MAVTLSTRAGTSLIRHLIYRAPDGVELMSSDGYTARFQLRSLFGSRPVVISTHAVTSPENAVFLLVEESHWRLNLSGDVTKILPPSSQFEIELVNDDDPSDVRPFATGIINVTPQGVIND